MNQKPNTDRSLLRRQKLNNGFSPNNLENNMLWLRSDLGIALNGNNVSEWSDQSPSNYNVSRGVEANQPAFTQSAINGYPALTFDGNDFLNTITLSEPGDEYTVFIVANLQAPGSQYFAVSMGSGSLGSDEELSWYVNNGDQVQLRIGNGATNPTDTGTQLPLWGVWSGQAVSGDSKLWLNGNLKATDDAAYTLATIDRLVVGGRSNQTLHVPNNTQIAEIIFYRRILNNTERQQVENYLKRRYDL